MPIYALRRIMTLVPTFVLATMIVFAVVRLIPGDVVDLMVSQNDIGSSSKTRGQLIEVLGLNVPMPLQYFRWMSGLVLHLDLGRSLWTNETVASMIFERLPTTLYLGVLSILFALLIALPVGVLSAMRQDSAADYIGRSIAILALSVPAFGVGTMVVVLPAVWWNVAPTTDYVSFFTNPLLSLRQMALPALVLGIALSGITMRMMRTMVLEVMRQDYIRTAWSKGLDESTIIVGHVLKNAMLPVITVIGLQVPLVLGGAVVVEQIFVISGMGQLLLDAVSKRDYPVVSGIFLVVGSGVLLINLIVDLSYGLLDPKIRQG
jgi:peptide/nickel transport system permease protein